MTRRHDNVVNEDEVEAADGPMRGSYQSKLKGMGRAAGAQQIGATLYELRPGCLAFPYHWHAHNEEALIVLGGEGTLRIGDREIALRAGDFVAFPTGSAHAHQLRATGEAALRYYCLSTMNVPEICGYPDSAKFAAYIGRGEDRMRVVVRTDDTRDYFEGDPFA